MKVADVPVNAVGDVLSVAVKVPLPPAVSDTVYEIVATPLELVVDVVAAKVPPRAVVDQETTLPAIATLVSEESCNCAVTVIVLPAVGALLASVTPYLLALPYGVTAFEAADVAPVPLVLEAVTVKVYAVPAVRLVTEHEVVVLGEGVHVRPPGDAVTV